MQSLSKIAEESQSRKGSRSKHRKEEEEDILQSKSSFEKGRVQGISALKAMQTMKDTNFGLQNGRDDDLDAFLGKREQPSRDEKEEEKKSEIIKTMEQRSARIQRLQDVERLGRRIKEESKSKALWSTGIIEVDVGMNKKLETIEQSEDYKRQQLIDSIADKIIPDVSKGEVKNSDIKDHLWKPKDGAKIKKKMEKRAMQHFLQSFSQDQKKFAKKVWNNAFREEGARQEFHNYN